MEEKIDENKIKDFGFAPGPGELKKPITEHSSLLRKATLR